MIKKLEKMMNKKIYRIFDANLNRAREGLRVAEELARMVLEDERLQKKIKDMRHQIILIEKKMTAAGLLSNRSVYGDPGAGITNKNEVQRKTFHDLGRANLRRCQEALRVLEEFSKLETALASKAFKKLRFQSYELESELIEKISCYERKRKK